MDGEAFKTKQKKINIESKEVDHLCWFTQHDMVAGSNPNMFALSISPEAHGFTSIWQIVPQTCEIGGDLPDQQELQIQIFFLYIPFLLFKYGRTKQLQP